VVTTFDLLDLLVFLFQRHIRRWHDILTSGIEQGNPRAEDRDAGSVELVGGSNEQVYHGNPSASPERSRNEIHRLQVMQELGYDINALNRSGMAVEDSVRFDPRNVEERSSIQGPGIVGFTPRLDGREACGRFSGAVAAIQPKSVGWNAGMLQHESQEAEEADLDQAHAASDIHPAYRSKFDNTSRPSRDSFHTPEQAPGPPVVKTCARNQI
jgi:hypothetical protein